MAAALVVATEEQLRAIVREELARALAGHAPGIRREVVSKRTAARMLGIDRGKTLATLLADGTLRTVEIRGRVCIPREDVDRVISTGAPTATPTAKRRHGVAGGAAALRALDLDDL